MPNRLEQSERAQRAALQSLASHLADVSAGEPMQGDSVAGLLTEIDGGTGAIDDDTLDRITRGRVPSGRRERITLVDPDLEPGS